jgi:iron complex outermembrane receptor protein
MRRLIVAALALLPAPVLAQRADENAATAAEDAFGTSVGNESVGIYASGQVRGFSAYDAGNGRLEGLYFDEVGGITDLILSGSDIHVGLTAFGKPFPAPTGILDQRLRRVTADRTIISVRLNSGQYFGPDASVEAAIPLADNLGLIAGLGYFDEQATDGSSAWFISRGGVLRWRPVAGTELTALYSRYDYGDEEMGPTIYTAGAFLPKRIERRVFFGQDWGQWKGHSVNHGALAKSERGPWLLEAGLFRSRFTQDDYASAWFDDVGEDGVGNRFVLSGKDQETTAWSGEARVSRDLTEGKRRHRLVASFRGRDVDAGYGGYHLAALGSGATSVPDPETEPVRTYSALTTDTVRQRDISLGYELRWLDIGEFNAGVTRGDYRKEVTQPNLTPLARRDRDWLWNAALAVHLAPGLTAYGATTRGLEESGTAPGSAANANEVLPALRTRQWEAGLRASLPLGLRAVAAWFDLEKPYFATDTRDNIYRILGAVRHRGVELLLAGEPVPDLSVIAGAVLLDADVTGEAVEEGRVGEKPIGRSMPASTGVRQGRTVSRSTCGYSTKESAKPTSSTASSFPSAPRSTSAPAIGLRSPAAPRCCACACSTRPMSSAGRCMEAAASAPTPRAG